MSLPPVGLDGSELTPPVIQEEEDENGGIVVTVPRARHTLSGATPPSNLAISPPPAVALQQQPLRRTPPPQFQSQTSQQRRGSFLSRQNAIQTSSSSGSTDASRSGTPSPVATPLFGAPPAGSATYRGSEPNIAAASAPLRPQQLHQPLSELAKRHHPSSSQPSLTGSRSGSRSRTSSCSPLGSVSSGRALTGVLDDIPRITPPPNIEPVRRRGSRSGSTSPNQLQLPLRSFGNNIPGRYAGDANRRSPPFADTTFCPAADGTGFESEQPPSYDECVDPEEQARIARDLAADEALDPEDVPECDNADAETPLTLQEEKECDAEVEQITGVADTEALLPHKADDNLTQPSCESPPETIRLERISPEMADVQEEARDDTTRAIYNNNNRNKSDPTAVQLLPHPSQPISDVESSNLNLRGTEVGEPQTHHSGENPLLIDASSSTALLPSEPDDCSTTTRTGDLQINREEGGHGDADGSAATASQPREPAPVLSNFVLPTSDSFDETEHFV